MSGKVSTWMPLPPKVVDRLFFRETFWESVKPILGSFLPWLGFVDSVSYRFNLSISDSNNTYYLFTSLSEELIHSNIELFDNLSVILKQYYWGRLRSLRLLVRQVWTRFEIEVWACDDGQWARCESTDARCLHIRWTRTCERCHPLWAVWGGTQLDSIIWWNDGSGELSAHFSGVIPRPQREHGLGISFKTTNRMRHAQS